MTALLTATGEASCDPVSDPRWRALTDGHGDLFSSQRWLAVLTDGYGLDFRATLFGASADGRSPRGGLAWADIADVRGRRMASLPFSDFADPPGHVEPEEIAAAVSNLTDQGLPLSFRVLRSQPPDVEGLTETGRLGWHQASLPGEESELWTSIRSGARQNVRKAQKNDVVVTAASSPASLEGFRRLHVGLRKSKYRMLAQPTRFFRAIAAHFGPDDYRVVTATLDGEVVAGVVLLRHGDTAYYKFNASSDRGLAVRANDAVMWSSMLEAQRWGCAAFDFGVSDLDQPGLIRYKRKYASEESEVVVLRAEGRATGGRMAEAVSWSLPRITRVLTADRCPEGLTSRGGDVLYRLFC